MRNPLLNPTLSADQKMQYIFTNVHYFSGFTILIYLCFPILYLLFGIHPLILDEPYKWLFHSIPYLITIYFLPLFLLGNMRLSTMSVSLSAFFAYLQAFTSVIFKTTHKWVTTEARQTRKPVLMMYIWPHVFFILLYFFAIPVGWYESNNVVTTFIMTCWSLLHAFILFTFIKFGILAEMKKI